MSAILQGSLKRQRVSLRLEVGRQEKKDGSSAIESDKASIDQPIPRSTANHSEADREKKSTENLAPEEYGGFARSPEVFFI